MTLVSDQCEILVSTLDLTSLHCEAKVNDSSHHGISCSHIQSLFMKGSCRPSQHKKFGERESRKLALCRLPDDIVCLLCCSAIEGLVMAISTNTQEKHGPVKVLVTSNTTPDATPGANKCSQFDLPNDLAQGKFKGHEKVPGCIGGLSPSANVDLCRNQ